MRRSEQNCFTVIGDDTGRFLAAMLQGMQPERSQRRRVGMPQNAKHTALFMQCVVIKGHQLIIVTRNVGHYRQPFRPKITLDRVNCAYFALCHAIWSITK